MRFRMSDPLRIGLVVEGPTDRIVIESVLAAVLVERNFVVTQLQPEDSETFGAFGGGWPGVYKWCHQAARQGGGRISGNALLRHFDLIVIQLDADVADFSYDSGNIVPESTDLPLPCSQVCPPPDATIDALRSVLLSWCGEPAVPPATVICMPSKSTEAWVVWALFPDDREVIRGSSFECFASPADRLAQQPVRRRIRKSVPDYRSRQVALTQAWPHLTGHGGLEQATRFDADLRDCISISDERAAPALPLLPA